MQVRDASIGRRFAWLVAILVAVPAAVCAGIAYQVSAMDRDADRLLEESREAAIASRLVVRIDTLTALVEPDGDAPLHPRVRAIAEQHVAAAKELVAQLQSPSEDEDPSREEHQSAEDDLTTAIDLGLERTERWIAQERGITFADVREQLEDARTHAVILSEETLRESVRADADVGRRSHAALAYAVGALVIVLLVASTVSVLVSRTVLGPIRELRAGADTLRRGELGHRLRVRSRDEIGELGRTLYAMADELSQSHAALERKIEQRTLELIRAARLADIGVLAAGVAHEINNPLGSIASCGEGLLRRVEAGGATPDEQRDYLRTIVSEAYRTREITTRLLNLARPAPSAHGRVDVRELFAQVEGLVRHLLEERSMNLSIELADGIGQVEGDPGELLQVLLNLVLNARDAGRTGGTVRLSARDDGKEQVWEVRDDGAGIAEADLERVFDPFFTTKAQGLGTGLGLSLVAAIVDRHGGSIEASNAPEGGAVFTLRFPRSTEETLR
ncbi:MAG: ATP-binding protein [Planctomycetota bacterium]